MQFVAILERRRQDSMYSSRAWPSAGRLRGTPSRSCWLLQDYLWRERKAWSRRWVKPPSPHNGQHCSDYSRPLQDSLPCSECWVEARESHRPAQRILRWARTRGGGGLGNKMREGIGEPRLPDKMPQLWTLLGGWRSPQCPPPCDSQMGNSMEQRQSHSPLPSQKKHRCTGLDVCDKLKCWVFFNAFPATANF